MITLYDNNGHRNVMFDDLVEGASVQANQHIIVDGDESILLDPGGHKVYPRLMGSIFSVIPPESLKYLFFSHQDPDIVAATNGWLMITDAIAYTPSLWTRFIPHFGVDDYVVDRLLPIADEGMGLDLGETRLKFIPAHFLHSAGNFQIYDPVSKILYSGDLGASLGQPYSWVEDFDAHVQYMEGFHKRYMTSQRALRIWANTIRQLDIEMIAPQHGAVFGNRELSNRFIDWLENLECGVDLLGESFPIPE